jgi:formylglycine-generating enzyme required for sulfatase activity
MHAFRPHADDLPEDLENEVLAILDGDENARPAALAALLERHAVHEAALRRWLADAGVDLPPATVASPGPPASSEEERLPQALGNYVLLERLGRGGFGTVFRGEQRAPIRRPVAIKVLNAGMGSRDLLARFAAEREALNRMDHPGIARLYDAGTTPQGRPFFVMELVAGPTLLAHCRRRSLPVRERVQLFLHVLDALQHAHQKAMLHRDLSANNVLVADPDGTPQPKIIDFGIAKSLRDPLLHGGAMTLHGTLLGTPEYMSPEQADGRLDVDTRADVYALGVQLYELLADALPIPSHLLRARGIAGIADIVRSHQPLPLSAAAPRARGPELRGDLEAIVGKAIAKDREERYASVGEFAADLRRHLADEPVHAAVPTTWYRLRKFVRRHRASSVAIAAAALAVVAALVLMALSLRIARDAAAEADRLRQLSDEKADAGFLLLANEDRLAAAIAAGQALGPPWPAHRQAYDDWLREHALPLAAERTKLRERLAALDSQFAAATHDRDEPSRRHLARALARLERQLDDFHGAQGPLHAVLWRRQLLDEVIAPAAAAHAEAFRAAAAAIERSDGRTAAREYRGLRIGELPGLVPLGADPRTGLHEFLDLASHATDYPLPVRDPATGALPLDAGTGIVFVLLPAGRLDQGALRNRPGADRDDDLAATDELHGGATALDAFLIARCELTRAQWNRLTGAESRHDDPRLPVVGVDWQQATAVLRGFGMALPTEAQWEYACRAGSRGPWHTGPDPAAVASAGWFGQGLQPVGLLAPNAFGLCDLHGNAAEWCADEKLSYADSETRRGDGLRQRRGAIAVGGDELRVVRGGAWHQGVERARTTARDGRPPQTRDGAIGIRAVRLLRP